METTTVFDKTLKAFHQGYRRIVNNGGTSSSKSYSILQLLLVIALKRQTSGVTISVVSETLPHLKLGAIRDFENILKNEGIYNERYINKTDHLYWFGKSFVEFFSADAGKATGPRRNILFLNECNNIPYPIVSELEQRTDETIFYDFNPTSDFWITKEVYLLPDAERCIIKSNFHDNQQLSESIRNEILSKASRDPNYKRIHIDVEFGVYEGLIFPDFTLVDEMPESEKQRYGLDFGFTNDPTAMVDIRVNGGGIYLNEMIYQRGLTNQDIMGKFREFEIKYKEIVADSAEPKSIEEFSRSGFNVKASVKGQDSIRRGIDLIKSYPIFVTKNSVNIIKELRNYRWATDKNGDNTNKPVDDYNHGLDACRYACEALLKPQATISFKSGARRDD